MKRGPKVTCNCGVCQKCYHREQTRLSRERRKKGKLNRIERLEWPEGYFGVHIGGTYPQYFGSPFKVHY